MCASEQNLLTQSDLAIALNLVNKLQAGPVVENSEHSVDFEKELDRLEQLKLIGELAAGIGHEVRNPLTIIRGFLQMFKAKKDLVEYTCYLEVMIQEIDRANSIITDFLNLSHNKDMAFELLNINDIINKLAPLIRADAFGLGKNINIDLGKVVAVSVDENSIRQCILNLLRNGLEAVGVNGTVTIKTFVQGERVVLAIKDNGSGIPAPIYAKLGTPFLTTKPHGTGLGLSICYRIAKHHDADIEVETSSEGTSFYVKFKIPNQS
ncbi:MAG: sensor signal transduction histidine kinase [Firmicutes bacterium]|nr:sensor signal transduction histidine kinase [Bacillota bacterium]